MEAVNAPPAFIWVTNIDTSEPVGVRVDQILLLEQKRHEDGGAVAVYLAHGKEIHVMESFRALREMIASHRIAMNSSREIGAVA